MALLDSGDGGDSTTPSSAPRSGGTVGDDSTSSGDGTLSGVLARFAANPKGFILGIVAAWIVGGILRVGGFAVDVILQVGDILLIVPRTIQDVVVDVGGAIGAPFLAFAAEFQAANVALAESLGPLSFLVIPLYLAIAIALVKLGAWLADLVEVPFIDLGAVVRGLSAVPRALWGVIRRG